MVRAHFLLDDHEISEPSLGMEIEKKFNFFIFLHHRVDGVLPLFVVMTIALIVMALFVYYKADQYRKTRQPSTQEQQVSEACAVHPQKLVGVFPILVLDLAELDELD